ncbi:MAG: isocitrate/isopropylmalate dehydrogenase family protein [Firmicutes bacterium]|nr:isocitrate/isopropylmalate dehydrogenase family protein [Bacillota bacterium]
MGYLLKFEQLLKEQLERVEKLKNEPPATDFSAVDTIKIGFIDGDGIGPVIMKETRRVLDELLKEEVESGKIEMRTIEGLTLENRIEKRVGLPEEVLAAVKECDVFMKGPTTTPNKTQVPFNLESANVALRRELDLFANVRPVCVPEKGIDWTFFRENTEGEYIIGSKGLEIGDDLCVDFKVTTTQGTERIARKAFEFARANGKNRIECVTKANIVKKTDGRFLEIVHKVGEEYPDIKIEDWYIDIMTANLVNEDLRKDFQVFVLPNLYGDIITDEAAQIQGGMGTAGSANIGNRYAMFEAVHGTAPRMVEEGIADRANPESLLKAAELMLRHIGYVEKADKLRKAVDGAAADPALNMSGTREGSSTVEFADAVLKLL